jgi:hypothetical protein
VRRPSPPSARGRSNDRDSRGVTVDRWTVTRSARGTHRRHCPTNLDAVPAKAAPSSWRSLRRTIATDFGSARSPISSDRSPHEGDRSQRLGEPRAAHVGLRSAAGLENANADGQ